MKVRGDGVKGHLESERVVLRAFLVKLSSVA